MQSGGKGVSRYLCGIALNHISEMRPAPKKNPPITAYTAVDGMLIQGGVLFLGDGTFLGI